MFTCEISCLCESVFNLHRVSLASFKIRLLQSVGRHVLRAFTSSASNMLYLATDNVILFSSLNHILQLL